MAHVQSFLELWEYMLLISQANSLPLKDALWFLVVIDSWTVDILVLNVVANKTWPPATAFPIFLVKELIWWWACNDIYL